MRGSVVRGRASRASVSSGSPTTTAHVRPAAGMMGPAMNLTDRQIKEARERYSRGEANQTQLAKELGTSRTIVADLLAGRLRKEAGGPFYRPKRRMLTNKQVEQIRKAYAKGTTRAARSPRRALLSRGRRSSRPSRWKRSSSRAPATPSSRAAWASAARRFSSSGSAGAGPRVGRCRERACRRRRGADALTLSDRRPAPCPRARGPVGVRL